MVRKIKGYLSAFLICIICSVIFIGIGYLYISASIKQTEKNAESVPYYSREITNAGLLFQFADSKTLIYLDFGEKAVTFVDADNKEIKDNMCCGYPVDYIIGAEYDLLCGIIDRIGGIELTLDGKEHNYTGVQVKEILEKTAVTSELKKSIAKAIFDKISFCSLSRSDFAYMIENSSTNLTVPDIFSWDKYIKETCSKTYFVN